MNDLFVKTLYFFHPSFCFPQKKKLKKKFNYFPMISRVNLPPKKQNQVKNSKIFFINLEASRAWEWFNTPPNKSNCHQIQIYGVPLSCSYYDKHAWSFVVSLNTFAWLSWGLFFFDIQNCFRDKIKAVRMILNLLCELKSFLKIIFFSGLFVNLKKNLVMAQPKQI